MNLQYFKKKFPVFVVAFVITMSAGAQSKQATVTGAGLSTQEVKRGRPNIIFILTDDHRWDALGAMGNKIIRTPHLDRLARGGVLFQNAYVTTSICAVSR